MYIYIYFLLLLITPNIPPVLGNNDAIKNEKLPIKYCIATGIKSKQTKTSLKNCVYISVAFIQVRRLGLHPGKLQA